MVGEGISISGILDSESVGFYSCLWIATKALVYRALFLKEDSVARHKHEFG